MSEQLKDLEQEARKLRDIIYVNELNPPITDEKWEFVKNSWAEDIEWLRKMAKNKIDSVENFL